MQRLLFVKEALINEVQTMLKLHANDMAKQHIHANCHVLMVLTQNNSSKGVKDEKA